jgi:phosphoheptose isomerase
VRQSTARATGTDHAVLQSGTAAHKRKRSAIVMVTGENGKKKKVVDETAFHPDLQKAITEIKTLVAKGMFRFL